ncbi:MAG: urease accessory protein UreE, partial [Aestuariivirga sp.]
MLKAVAVLPAGKRATVVETAGTAVLAHDERHLRRKAITLSDGGRILVDLPEPVMLSAGDGLVLED